MARSAYDTNGNGYVCAYQVRGTRAGTAVLYLFGIDDDKHVED